MHTAKIETYLTVAALNLCILPFIVTSMPANAACNDAVVMVHGNAGQASDWDNTADLLLANGYSADEVYIPDWGSRACATCNNHSGVEETPVKNAINDAIAASCTGKIDVIGHSMGVTLAAQQIIKEGRENQVDAFVGIAAAYRGLLTCGVYPYNVWNSTCGRYGLSVSSPFLSWLYGKQLAARSYSIKSWVDQVVCGSGTCYVYGKHSSRLEGEDATYSYNYGHFGLQAYTADKQYDLIR